MEPQPQVLSLKPYLDVVYRHRIGASCVFAIGLAITAFALMILPNIYKSSAVILVQPQTVAPAYVPGSGPNDTANRVRILTEEALSRAPLEEIIKQTGLYPRQLAQGKPIDEVVDNMRRHIFVDMQDQQGGGRLDSFKISFEYPGAVLAQRVTARLADIYVDEDLRQRSTQAVAASEFLRDQVANAQAKLDDKANEIKAYKNRYRGSLPEQLDENLRELDLLQEQLANLNQVMASSATVSPETKLTQLETELAILRAQYSESYPDVVALRAQIDALKKSQEKGHDESSPTPQVPAQGTTESAGGGAQTAGIESIQTQRAQLRAAIEQCRERIAQTPLRTQELAVLNRDYEILGKDYEDLQRKQMDAQVSARLEQRQEGERLRVLDAATLPLKPERPNRFAIAILGTLFSLLAAAGLPFAVFYTDTSFKDPDELAMAYGAPVLVAIPVVDELVGRGQRWWTVLRAVAASGMTLSAAVAILWVYATRFF